METDKIHQRVLEIQKNISTASPKQQMTMVSELLSLASQIEQSLDEIKLDINEIENQQNDEE